MTQAAIAPASAGSSREAPHLKGFPMLGNLLELRRDPIDLFTEVAEHGDVVGLRFGPAHYFLVNSPETVHHVLVDNNRNYAKSPNYKGLSASSSARKGWSTSEGSSGAASAEGSRSRPSTRDRVASFVAAMVDETVTACSPSGTSASRRRAGRSTPR